MASDNPPVRGQAYITYVFLRSQSNPHAFQINPTLASGDAKVSIDDGSFVNLDTLPTVSPAGSKRVKVTVSAEEMDGRNISILLSDADGNQWDDLAINLQTVAAGQQFDDLSTLVGEDVETAASAAIAEYDPPTKGEMDAGLLALGSVLDALGTALGELNDIDAETVKAQIVAALATDTHGEPAAPPAEEATLVEMIAWLKAITINEDVQTASQRTVKTRGGSGTLATAAVSKSPSQVTRGEFS